MSQEKEQEVEGGETAGEEEEKERVNSERERGNSERERVNSERGRGNSERERVNSERERGNSEREDKPSHRSHRRHHHPPHHHRQRQKHHRSGSGFDNDEESSMANGGEEEYDLETISGTEASHKTTLKSSQIVGFWEEMRLAVAEEEEEEEKEEEDEDEETVGMKEEIEEEEAEEEEEFGEEIEEEDEEEDHDEGDIEEALEREILRDDEEQEEEDADEDQEDGEEMKHADRQVPSKTFEPKRGTAQDLFSYVVSSADLSDVSSVQMPHDDVLKNLDLSGMTDMELTGATKQFRDEMNVIDTETTMFVNHIQRLITNGFQFKSRSELKLNVKLPSLFRKMTGLKGLTNLFPTGFKTLTMRHKVDVAKTELQLLKETIRGETNKARRAIKTAASGVIDLSRQLNTLRDKKAAFDEIFDSSTVLATGVAKPKNTNILKFWQEDVHKMETDVLKLRLKKVALKLHLAKMQSLTNQAAETNETLSENDIHLLKIKNHILSKKIKEGNENLLVLKVTAGKMRLKLNSLRASLLEAEKISSIVDNKILMANDQAEKSTQEIKHVNKGLAKIKDQNKNILRYINTYSVPEVVEYAKFVENVQPLERQIKHFSRKIDVKLIEIRKAEKHLNEKLRNKHTMSVKKCFYS